MSIELWFARLARTTTGVAVGRPIFCASPA
jgi:hypothetical protein